MMLQIGGGCGVKEFVNGTDRLAFLERKLTGLAVIASRSEFKTVQVERCLFTLFESI